MDIRKIKKLIEMLQESDLKEIEVSQGDESVRILRSGLNETGANKVIQQTEVYSTEPNIEQKIEPKKIEGNIITSPIVGTFYRKPSPDKDPFIKVGDSVEQGDVLCIIEAMKMMNEIKSDFSGKIVSIDVEDGQPVEYGQHIITIN
ncbi:acetyl-CoA carboxylase biotin carboxyl carrier protein [Gammaproteobacteria bacterium]|jgi:acetyl-CoA carboxylase biotin carboxyl carrier protein|nr:acetyl-CoA carboxylase biotin carboxyl carrier protein [Gammaproteobacteria bacterium]MDA9765974.1 acetyl-CoA carboxylase biotin carboxyl carrier protein [Gammaproteobacteria bacterium]MDA9867359.1 acetyl-CoA carboxylase biotin carboxyl carrier protein [Gammaproteobacteria bacterium]MDC1007576.1 acetyl-CoA carboxylase biotin carboxyl carrier protein [Gammaproteobacteria bacterium]MDC3217314.1 acetyl-CoA carboxylase biotin carboxyl carrier protein [Gammaproteobacteria bacterium]|tara:strand:+ start:368 stop:805 length:438 start_codon:yes stop_codon:yes gene_type:complete